MATVSPGDSPKNGQVIRTYRGCVFSGISASDPSGPKNAPFFLAGVWFGFGVAGPKPNHTLPFNKYKNPGARRSPGGVH
jgi:hypothetical protein